jgi:polyferredoxin
VMTKLNRPVRLIAYDTEVNIKRRAEGKSNIFKPIRARTILYAAIITIVSGVMLYALLTRAPFTISVIHDRNPVYVKLSGGDIRNAYTMRIANYRNEERKFMLSVYGLSKAKIDIVGQSEKINGTPIISVGPDQTHEVRVLLTTRDLTDVPYEPPELVFEIRDVVDHQRATARDFFRSPNTIH